MAPPQSIKYSHASAIDWDDILFAHHHSTEVQASRLRKGTAIWMNGKCVMVAYRKKKDPKQELIFVQGRDVVTKTTVEGTVSSEKIFKRLFPVYAKLRVGPERIDRTTGELLEEFLLTKDGIMNGRWVEPRTRDIDIMREGLGEASCQGRQFYLNAVAFKVDAENQVEIIDSVIE